MHKLWVSLYGDLGNSSWPRASGEPAVATIKRTHECVCPARSTLPNTIPQNRSSFAHRIVDVGPWNEPIAKSKTCTGWDGIDSAEQPWWLALVGHCPSRGDAFRVGDTHKRLSWVAGCRQAWPSPQLNEVSTVNVTSGKILCTDV